ncbi:PA2779 family protein [Thermocrinis sp.]
MWRKLRSPIIALGVAGWFFFLNSAPALAGLVESKPVTEELKNTNRDEEIKKIQKALEIKIVQEKLKAYGLSKEEVERKLSEMDDQQIHMLAKASERVLAGGDLGLVIGVLLIAILLVILLKLLNKEIIIR